jgi:hypothetical protein
MVLPVSTVAAWAIGAAWASRAEWVRKAESAAVFLSEISRRRSPDNSLGDSAIPRSPADSLRPADSLSPVVLASPADIRSNPDTRSNPDSRSRDAN